MANGVGTPHTAGRTVNYPVSARIVNFETFFALFSLALTSTSTAATVAANFCCSCAILGLGLVTGTQAYVQGWPA